MTALTATDVHVRLGAKAVLNGVTAAFHRGQVAVIAGPNGAGKSTLLGCLAGLAPVDRGKVRIGEADIRALPPRRRAQRIGFLPQLTEIGWAVDVRTFVGLGRTPFIGGLGLTAADRTAVNRALSLTESEPLAARIVTTLSGGERARVLLARAIAGEPEWLLADEPLTGLDPGHQWDAVALLRRLAADGCGIIMTMHDLHTALRATDRALILADGRVLADDVPERALTAAVLGEAYGIDVRFSEGIAGRVIEIVGRFG